jgi:tRNA-dihydrouridine synthase C
VSWAQIQPLLGVFWVQMSARVERRHRAGRLKQWLNYLRRRHPQAQTAFDELRLRNDAADIEAWLSARAPLPAGAAPAALQAPATPAALCQPC